MKNHAHLIPFNLAVGDCLYHPYFGEGVVTKVIREHPGVVHMEYRRGNIHTIHLAREFLNVRRTKMRWEMQDPILGDRPIEGYVEVFTYDLIRNRMTSLVKPFYKSSNTGRLRFSFRGDPYKHGILPTRLGKVQYIRTNELMLMYVLQDDPKKEVHKTSMWRAVTRRLVASLEATK